MTDSTPVVVTDTTSEADTNKLISQFVAELMLLSKTPAEFIVNVAKTAASAAFITKELGLPNQVAAATVSGIPFMVASRLPELAPEILEMMKKSETLFDRFQGAPEGATIQ